MRTNNYYHPRKFPEPWGEIFNKAKLTPLEIGIIDYVFWDEFTPERVGQILGYEPKQVKAMLSKAIKKLDKVGLDLPIPHNPESAYEVREYPFDPFSLNKIY